MKKALVGMAMVAALGTAQAGEVVETCKTEKVPFETWQRQYNGSGVQAFTERYGQAPGATRWIPGYSASTFPFGVIPIFPGAAVKAWSSLVLSAGYGLAEAEVALFGARAVVGGEVVSMRWWLSDDGDAVFIRECRRAAAGGA